MNKRKNTREIRYTLKNKIVVRSKTKICKQDACFEENDTDIKGSGKKRRTVYDMRQ